MNTQRDNSLIKVLSQVCGTLAIASAVLVILTLIVGDSWTLPWFTDTEYIKSPLFLEYFTIEGKPIGLQLDQITSWTQFKTGHYQFLAWPQYALLGLTLFAFVLISVVITYLERFWYLVSAGIMVFVSINFGLDELALFNNNLTYIFIGLLLACTYYLNSFNQNASFLFRFSITFLIFILFTSLCLWLSPVLESQFVWTAFGIFAPLTLAGLFLIFVAGDNCFYLFKIATQNAPSGKNGLVHFLIIGAIYILLLVLLFLNMTGDLNFDLILIHPYLILAITLVSGYFVINLKLEIVESELPTRLIRRMLYPAFSALTLMIIAYTEITANDSLINSIHISIIISHLAFAVVYYIYCFMNFTPYLMANEPAWQNFFKGERAPLLTGRIAAIVFMVGMLFFLNYKPYYHLRAGQYNALGELAEHTENDLLAAQYYRQAIFYDYASVKANYSLAMLEKQGNSSAQAIKKFETASIRSKNHKPDLALSQYYNDKGQLFNKLLHLKEVKNSNEDEKVLNSLAIAHFEFKHLDTAYLLMQKAYEIDNSTTIASNYLALDLSLKESLNIDSVLSETSKYTDPKVKTNRQALANATYQAVDFNMELAKDSFLLIDDLYYLYNTSLNAQSNSEEIIKALDYYLAYPRNVSVYDYLKLGKALQLYQLGQVNEAVLLLNDMIASYGSKAGLYSYIKALWAYHQGAMNLGIVFLADAKGYNFDTEIIAATYLDLKDRQIDQVANGLETEWKTYQTEKSSLNQEQKIEKLTALASKNAFKDDLTIKAIEELRSVKTDEELVYELLQKAHSLNNISIPLFESFIYQSVEVGLSAVGQNALEELKPLVSEADFERVRQTFEQRKIERTERSLNIQPNN